MICTWCDETQIVDDGDPVYVVCSWCKNNDMPMHCTVCRKIFSISDMLKTRNEHDDGRFVFCCKNKLCVGEIKKNLHLLKKES
jgi:hypothetical protein